LTVIIPVSIPTFWLSRCTFRTTTIAGSGSSDGDGIAALSWCAWLRRITSSRGSLSISCAVRPTKTRTAGSSSSQKSCHATFGRTPCTISAQQSCAQPCVAGRMPSSADSHSMLTKSQQVHVSTNPCALLCTHFNLSATVRDRSPRAGCVSFCLLAPKYARRGISANVIPQNS